MTAHRRRSNNTGADARPHEDGRKHPFAIRAAELWLIENTTHVVPAKAGTHHHRRCDRQSESYKATQTVQNRNVTAYGSPLARGRPEKESGANGLFEIRIGAPAREQISSPFQGEG